MNTEELLSRQETLKNEARALTSGLKAMKMNLENQNRLIQIRKKEIQAELNKLRSLSSHSETRPGHWVTSELPLECPACRRHGTIRPGKREGSWSCKNGGCSARIWKGPFYYRTVVRITSQNAARLVDEARSRQLSS